MINVSFINGSPKVNSKSNSSHFIQELSKSFDKNININEFSASKILNDNSALEKISLSDKIIFVSPLYADTLPSHMIEFLTILEKYLTANSYTNIDIYGMINCGFYEGIQCRHALDMFKYFSRKCKLNWKFGIGIGGGEYLRTLSETSAYTKSLYKALNILSNSINNVIDNSNRNIFICPDKMNAFAYRTAANLGWFIQAKKQYNTGIIKLFKKAY